ncbi:nucleotidyltransferase family protein [Neorhizobium sp. BT27B]|uniref:nucleotidyltransferase family protein n=1 Tax=Neorhizobium sp. BT27B TaxID=3142625 RepID=UPI003D291341
MGARVAIAVLAAGRSARMGDFNKLLAVFGGTPLVRLSVQRAAASGAYKVIVVTGHMEFEIQEALSGLSFTAVHNDAFALGLSSSIRAALQAVPEDCVGVLIHLADMPLLNERHMSSMIDIFKRAQGTSVVRATAFGEPGNPVILPRTLFRALGELTGDKGARQVIAASGLPVIDVELGLPARCDVDNVEALEAAGGLPPIVDPR